MSVKGFGGYIEIFKGGMQTASNGSKHDGDKLIDKALSTFSAGQHEPPAVIGHPKNNAPAYAWVEGLKEGTRDGGKTLLAKFKQVVPEFEEMVEKGLFKKRSACFYPDGRLRHVGFLGAQPPAVKGLADIGFSDEDEQLTFEFNESWKITTIGRVLGNIRDFFIEKHGIDEANKVISQWEIEDIKQTTNESPEAFSDGGIIKGGVDMKFTQEQLDAKILEAREEEKTKLAADGVKKAREKQFSDDLAEIQEFCESMVQEGKIAPAWIDGGLKEFMESQAGAKTIEFSEGGKKTPLEWFMDFFENQMPKLVEFKEVAGRDTDLPGIEAEFAECEDEDRIELHKKINALAAKDNISYVEAADLISQ